MQTLGMQVYVSRWTVRNAKHWMTGNFVTRRNSSVTSSTMIPVGGFDGHHCLSIIDRPIYMYLICSRRRSSAETYEGLARQSRAISSFLPKTMCHGHYVTLMYSFNNFCKTLDCLTDVVELELRYPYTNVPAEETNYFCMTFELDLPPNKTYHLVGTRPLLNNTMVAHHMIVFGCNPKNASDDCELQRSCMYMYCMYIYIQIRQLRTHHIHELFACVVAYSPAN